MASNMKVSLSVFGQHKEPTAKAVLNVFDNNIFHSPSFFERHCDEECHLEWFRKFVTELESKAKVDNILNEKTDKLSLKKCQASLSRSYTFF